MSVSENTSDQSLYFACQRKKFYPTLLLAQRAETAIRKRNGPDLFAYPCRFCGGFHLCSREHQERYVKRLPVPTSPPTP